MASLALNTREQNQATPPSFLRSVGINMVGVTASSAVDIFLSTYVADNLSNLGFCLGSFVPKNTRSWCRYIEGKIGTFNTGIVRTLSYNNPASKIMASAACEEIEFRWFLQEVLLRKLPKAALQKIAPRLTEMVDSLPARISRVAAASLLFALCHSQVLDCSAGGGIGQLMGGLFYGAIYEYTGSLSTCTTMHFLYNVFVKILAQQTL
jgi:membrane protease YdiL (CAAX protease family)